MLKKKEYRWVIIALIFVFAAIVLFVILISWKMPYVVKEGYTDNEYSEMINAENCDLIDGCSCVEYSRRSPSVCESCYCIWNHPVTKYKKYCSLIKRISGNC